MNRRLAIVFPGIGYHKDKPLLYYSMDIVSAMGFECVDVLYGVMPTDVKYDKKKKQDAFALAREAVEKQLSQIAFDEFETVLFISKSLGSILAANYATNHGLDVKHIVFTPVQETLSLPIKEGIVFHGTSDNWIVLEDLDRKCEEEGLQLYLTEAANHSLETEDTLQNIDNLRCIMSQVEEYVEMIGGTRIGEMDAFGKSIIIN